MAIRRWQALWLLFLLLFSSSALHAATVRIILNDWASQHAVSKIYASLISKVGLTPEFVTLPTSGQWYYLKFNYVDVQVEVWQGTMEDKLEQLMVSGAVKIAGAYPINTREEWWYPSYMAELCPGLPDWKALNDCAHLFSEGDDPRGVYYSGPWEKNDVARIRALDLNYRVKNLKDDEELVFTINEAYKTKKPILIFNWTPNWVEASYDGTFVQFPAYAPECETRPKWGINRTLLYDCGSPTSGWIKKIAAKSFADSQPCALSILENMTFSAKDLAEFALQINIQSKTSDEASTLWLEQNKERWQTWLGSNSCKG